MLVVNDPAAWEGSGAAEGNWDSAVCAGRQETPGVGRPSGRTLIPYLVPYFRRFLNQLFGSFPSEFLKTVGL